MRAHAALRGVVACSLEAAAVRLLGEQDMTQDAVNFIVRGIAKGARVGAVIATGFTLPDTICGPRRRSYRKAG